MSTIALSHDKTLLARLTTRYIWHVQQRHLWQYTAGCASWRGAQDCGLLWPCAAALARAARILHVGYASTTRCPRQVDLPSRARRRTASVPNQRAFLPTLHIAPCRAVGWHHGLATAAMSRSVHGAVHHTPARNQHNTSKPAHQHTSTPAHQHTSTPHTKRGSVSERPNGGLMACAIVMGREQSPYGLHPLRAAGQP